MRLVFDYKDSFSVFSSSSSIYCLNKIDYIFAPMDDDRPCFFKGMSFEFLPGSPPLLLFVIHLSFSFCLLFPSPFLLPTLKISPSPLDVNLVITSKTLQKSLITRKKIAFLSVHIYFVSFQLISLEICDILTCYIHIHNVLNFWEMLSFMQKGSRMQSKNVE